MKTQILKNLRFLSVFCWAVVALGRPCPAQTPPVLNMQLYAGMTITGTVGRVHLIQYVSALEQTNDASAWRCLEFLQLPASPYLWTDKSAPATGQRFYRAVVRTSAPTNMVFIPPGTFRMGSPPTEVDGNEWEGPRTAVTISRGFLIGKYEVTQGEYLAVTGTNPSICQPPHFPENLTRPVENVTWFDATNYCGLLTERERAAGRISTNSEYRLPTEAEWEYACRGWTSTRFSHGDDVDYATLTNFAWYAANSESMSHPVGQKLPNPWGLYDMHGSVREWCQSPCVYAGGIALDPQGSLTNSIRVNRGGGFWSIASECRSAYRVIGAPDHIDSALGFRVVLAPGQP